MVADLLIFDPQNVHAIADYLDPIRLAEGFDVVIVNGRIAREGDIQSPELAGRVLLPSH
jgi:N-acyl-D-aspartate/D-glutamate deacylase